MKTSHNTMRWLGLALIGSIIAGEGSVEAKKPVKPPPEPEPTEGPAYQFVSVDRTLRPESISDSGTLVGRATYEYAGGAFLTPAKLPVAFIDADGLPHYSINDLQILPDFNGEQLPGKCYAASDTGFAVGYVLRSGIALPVLWLPDGTPVELYVNQNGSNRHVSDINNDGWVFLIEIEPDNTGGVVVPLDTDLDGAPDTWFDDGNGDGVNDLFYPLDPLSPAMHTDHLSARAINDAGQLLVYESALDIGYLFTPDFSDADGDGNPWFADTDGDGFNDLWVELAPPVPGEGISVAGLNNLGQVAGNSGGYAVRWDFVDGVQVVTDLGAITSKAVMSTKGIDDAGRIVGISTIPTGRRTKPGPVWLADGDNLYELLPESGSVTETGINSFGWLFGWGWVAVPVEQP
jgi:hypothetical protein